MNGARVSFNQASDEMTERDEGLIRFLMRERHGSPFEHGYFRFVVKAPLFVVREHHRHRAGHSYNEWSGRYSKMEPEFYVPEFVRTQVGKPGAYSFEPVDEETARRRARRDRGERRRRAFEAYERMLEQGVAKEVARGRAAALDVHEVLLELQPAQPHALLLAAEPRGRAVRDPAVRRGRGDLPRAADAGHARGVRRKRPHRAVGVTS